MSEHSAGAAISAFCNVWKASIEQVLATVGVVSPNVLVVELSAPSALPEGQSEKSAMVRFGGAGCLKGGLAWVAEKAVALQLAQALMSEPTDPSASFSETHLEAFAELLRQVAGLTATAWKQEVACETELVFQAGSTEAFASTQGATYRVSGEKFPEISLQLLLDGDLCAALVALPSPGEGAASADAQVPADRQIGAAPPQESNRRLPPLPPSLELVLDAEMPACIRLGTREMLVRDVAALVPGMVVELNRMVHEPMELLVANRSLARGELVLVDGRLGLRITQVAGLEERAAVLADHVV